MSTFTNHGFGIVTFHNVIDIDFQSLKQKLVTLEDEARAKNFTIIYDELGAPLHAVNQGGFIYSLESMNQAPLRLQGLGLEIYEKYEAVLYGCLLQYISIFPALLQCLWWRSTGHILSYSAGAALGLHCDNDVNYRYGSFPNEQHATRNVVSAIVFINSSVNEADKNEDNYCGGTMSFPYADTEIIPKAGDVLLFPANYVGAHQINTVTKGKRYSYLGWFAQGSPHDIYNISPMDEFAENGGQVWMKTIIDDYDEYLNATYAGTPPAHMIAHRRRSNDHK